MKYQKLFNVGDFYQLVLFETINLIVNPGDLVIFPHWLVHSVAANTSGRERISIACNIMFSNYMSEMVKPMW